MIRSRFVHLADLLYFQVLLLTYTTFYAILYHEIHTERVVAVVKTYNVAEVAKMLSVDPETVRRWIRTKKLIAQTPSSRREGNIITEEALRNFLEDNHHAKYAKSAAKALALSSAVPIGGALAATAIEGAVAAAGVTGAAGAAAAASLIGGTLGVVSPALALVMGLALKGIASDKKGSKDAIEAFRGQIAKKKQKRKELQLKLDRIQQEISALEREIADEEQLLAILKSSAEEAEKSIKEKGKNE